jgi:hypothetical protein
MNVSGPYAPQLDPREEHYRIRSPAEGLSLFLRRLSPQPVPAIALSAWCLVFRCHEYLSWCYQRRASRVLCRCLRPPRE